MSQCSINEDRRLELQASLDAAKSQAERNKLGQFATPTSLASGILSLADSLLPQNSRIRFLDPAFGTGAFYSALLSNFSSDRIQSALAFEIDRHYWEPAARLWGDSGLNLRLGDFTQTRPPREESEKASLVICNPPYVRHHHLDSASKQRLRMASFEAASVDLNGLTGLYCHFLCLSHAWMAKDGVAIWLIPSEFMDVNYGRPMKEYLLKRVTLLRVHRFDPAEVQFDDATVSSAVVCFRNSLPLPGHEVHFTYGGSLTSPAHCRMVRAAGLDPRSKWTGLALTSNNSGPSTPKARLSDLFQIRRGIATGANGFFVITEARANELQIPREFLRPILPSPRYVYSNTIAGDDEGNPLIDRKLFLIDCRSPEEEVRDKYPALWSYLESEVGKDIKSRYLCKHRSPWYSQEDREPAPILCTYMGRSRNGKVAFRFILNKSKAIAANVYLMLYPKAALKKALQDNPELLTAVWSALGEIPWATLKDVGRVYGGGLHKMEPKELAEAPADTILAILPGAGASHQLQLALSW